MSEVGLLSDVLDLVSTCVITGGGLWLVWGVIVLAGGLKDKNGPALQSGIWQIVGGGLIILAAALFKNVTSTTATTANEIFKYAMNSFFLNS